MQRFMRSVIIFLSMSIIWFQETTLFFFFTITHFTMNCKTCHAINSPQYIIIRNLCSYQPSFHNRASPYFGRLRIWSGSLSAYKEGLPPWCLKCHSDTPHPGTPSTSYLQKRSITLASHSQPMKISTESITLTWNVNKYICLVFRSNFYNFCYDWYQSIWFISYLLECHATYLQL